MDWNDFTKCIQTDVTDMIHDIVERRTEKKRLDLSEEQIAKTIKHGAAIVDHLMAMTKTAGPVVTSHVLGTLVAESYFIYAKAPGNSDFPVYKEEED